MNEISKLYENCGIEVPIARLKTFKDDNGEIFTRPPFTAEKQIKITQKLWELRPNIYPNFDLLVNHSYSEMIAIFVNNLWQELTEEERKQIKEILE